jgi:hypothetical protein
MRLTLLAATLVGALVSGPISAPGGSDPRGAPSGDIRQRARKRRPGRDRKAFSRARVRTVSAARGGVLDAGRQAAAIERIQALKAALGG